MLKCALYIKYLFDCRIRFASVIFSMCLVSICKALNWLVLLSVRMRWRVPDFQTTSQTGRNEYYSIEGQRNKEKMSKNFWDAKPELLGIRSRRPIELSIRIPWKFAGVRIRAGADLPETELKTERSKGMSGEPISCKNMTCSTETTDSRECISIY